MPDKHEHALRALEFDDVVAQLAAKTTCEPGKRAILAMRPLTTRQQADEEQTLVEDAMAFVQAGGDIALGGVSDISELIARAEKGATISGIELRAIAEAERALRSIAANVAPERSSSVVSSERSRPADALARPRGAFKALLARRQDTRDLVRKIDDAVEPEGRVADAASPELARIRRQQRVLHDEIRDRCAAITRNASTAKMLSEPVVTVRAGRYVVPVRKEFAGEFPGVVHDESSSGSTVYVEPLASVEANNRLRALESAEEREIARILAQLTSFVASKREELRINAALLARLDAVGAVARWGSAHAALRPALNERPMLRIVGGRHPLLTRTAKPLDVEVGIDFDALVISGPNMGGKSVALKTMGLFCLLAYSGVPVPAQPGTEIGWFDRIACVLGDEQSIAQNLSSFSAHLEALRGALEGASKDSLVLVDEIGSGTEPVAGAALAQAFIEALLAVGARIVVTTHYTQLKVFAAATERVANASMLFDAGTNAPTHILALGVPGQSLAFPLARALRLPAPMIARAETLLGEEGRSLESAFEGLAAERAELQKRQFELEALRAQTGRLEQQLVDQAAAFQRERKQFENRAAAVLDDAVRQVRAELMERAAQSGESRRRQRVGSAPGADLDKTLEDMRKSLGLQHAAPDDPAARQLRQGDRVHVRSFGAPGVVSELYDRDALVTMGSVKVVVPRSELSADLSGNVAPERNSGVRTSAARSQGIEANEASGLTEIDVRGMRVDEAMMIVDKALDSATLAGADQLRIIHGKGTGQLGKGIREFLRDHAQVGGLAQAGDREGGSGVTIVTLR
ncbi:MAG TPA: endonuclease MutS2 [Candidatus Eremiobacteraceae bacterium]|nr:endonuclease MutS2 [Candidatus Eremiobacteraceae bacterium]